MACFKRRQTRTRSQSRRARQWVLAIRARLLHLADVKEQQLFLDVADRWDSVLLLITVFLKLWPIVSGMRAGEGVLDELVASDSEH